MSQAQLTDGGAAVGQGTNYGWTAQVSQTCDLLAPTVLQLLSSLGARRVLDVGSGNGAISGLLAAAGHDVVGVEQDRQGVDLARAAHPKVPFYCFGVQSDPAELLSTEAPFDAVVSTEVIEHLFSPQQLPAYAAGALKPHGHLIVTTPYYGYLKNLAMAVAGKWDHHHTALWHGGHIKFFSRATLTELLSDNGFDVIQFHGVGRLPYLWMSMVLVARKR